MNKPQSVLIMADFFHSTSFFSWVNPGDEKRAAITELMGLTDKEIDACPVTVVSSVPDTLGAQPPHYDSQWGAHPFTKLFQTEINLCTSGGGSSCTAKDVLEKVIKDRSYFINSKDYISSQWGETFQPVGEDKGAPNALIGVSPMLVTPEQTVGGSDPNAPPVGAPSFKQTFASGNVDSSSSLNSDDMMQMGDRPTNVYERQLAEAKAEWLKKKQHTGSNFAFRSMEMMQVNADSEGNSSSAFLGASSYAQMGAAIKAHMCAKISQIGWTPPLVTGAELNLGDFFAAASA